MLHYLRFVVYGHNAELLTLEWMTKRNNSKNEKRRTSNNY